MRNEYPLFVLLYYKLNFPFVIRISSKKGFMNRKLSSNKRVNEVIKLASQAGWKVEKRGSGHISLYPPSKDGEIITLPSSPSSTRNWKNMLSKLRKNGLNV